MGAKKLTAADAHVIFACLEKNEKPPEELEFEIIRVVKKGIRLSPPPIELKDGLYVLIRSQEVVPSNFLDKVLPEQDLARFPHCAWNVSGPQCDKHRLDRHGFQQRYCYPQGNPAYSSSKAGQVWTKLDSTGNEDINCRLLHLYQTKKRKFMGPTTPRVATKSPTRTQEATTHVDKRNSGREGSTQLRKKKSKVKRSKSPSTVGELERTSNSLSPQESYPSFELNGDSLPVKEGVMQNAFNLPFMPVETESFDEMTMMDEHLSFDNAADTVEEPSDHENDVPTVPLLMPVSPNLYGTGLPIAAPPFSHLKSMPVPPNLYGTGLPVAPPPPPVPQLKSTLDHSAARDTPTSINEFSQSLKEYEAKLMEDIRGSKRFDKALKLHLLVKWAKGVAQKPLQTPAKEQVIEAKSADRLQHIREQNFEPWQAD